MDIGAVSLAARELHGTASLVADTNWHAYSRGWYGAVGSHSGQLLQGLPEAFGADRQSKSTAQSDCGPCCLEPSVS